MNGIDWFVAINLAIHIAFDIPFILWQADAISLPDDYWLNKIKVMDLIENVMLVLTRFFPVSPAGRVILCIFYIENILMLVLQLLYSGWGFKEDVQTSLWIAFYIVLIINDICQINVIMLLINALQGETMQAIDSYLQNSYLGAVLSAIAVALAKMLLSRVVKRKGGED